MSNTIPTPALNEELVKAVGAAINPEEIKAAILAEAQKQFAATESERVATDAAAKDVADKKAAADKAAADATKTYTRTEVIGGKEFNFEAVSELELATKVADAYRLAYSLQPTTQAAQVVEKTPTQEEIAAAAQAEAAAKAELELRFKRGEVSTADYLEQSGAFGDYLAKKGLSVDALQAAVKQNQTTQYEKSWAQATEEFLHSPAGADWPGGDLNREQLGLRLVALNLTDATDKVAALAQAYNEMKKSKAIFPNEAATTQQTTQAQPTQQQQVAKTAGELAAEKVLADQAAVRAAAAAAEAARTAPTSSSLFDRSSGTSEHIVNDKTKPTEFQIDPKATPAEILDAYKKYLVANGQDPNAAFTQQFSKPR